MPALVRLVPAALLLVLTAARLPDPHPPASVAALDTALVRMGGAEALGRLTRVQREGLTQWQRTSFETRPYTDQPSFELHTDLRDYDAGAWRNTRRFYAGTAWRSILDVVADTVGARRVGTAWTPLNTAYLDERRELFTFAPERVLLLARQAPDLRARPDTTIGGVAHARAAATLDGIPATLLFRRTDGFLAAALYRAAQPNDFGLVPFGRMPVEVWYSNWQKLRGGVTLPMQLDVQRVGRPYKRMTTLALRTDLAAAMPDSFAVSDSLRQAFYATARAPMHDLPISNARVDEGRFATFGAFGSPSGAVRLGAQWWLLEPGVADLSAERAVTWLRAQAPQGTLGGVLLTTPVSQTANGGAPWLAGQRVPLLAGPGVMPLAAEILRQHGQRPTALTAVAQGRWIVAAGDSAWVEPIHYPDAQGALVVYVPKLRWAYSGPAATPVNADLLLAHARHRGWTVERIGHGRALVVPLSAPATR